jgi:hypothetical protein
MSWCIFIGSIELATGDVILGISDYKGELSKSHTDWPPYMNSAGNIKVMVF